MSTQNADDTPARALALETLRHPKATLSQLTQAIDVLDKSDYPKKISIGISASVTIDLLDLYLKKHAFLEGVSLEVHYGNFDDPLGDIDRFLTKKLENMILIPFFDLLLPALESQANALSENLLTDKIAEVRERFRLIFTKARTIPNLFVCKFHRTFTSPLFSGDDKAAHLSEKLNQVLLDEASAFNNIRLIDTEAILTLIGQQNAFDWRFYYRNKSPYSRTFLNELARRITLSSRAFGACYYKALVLDCDNTLWGGIIGEDLLSGIKLDPHDYPGNIFWRVQHSFSALEKQGVLLCLCSKNNETDVDEVFHQHPNMVLQDNQIALKKVNWDDKCSNLKSLASELNIGLESMVFLDDSDFECEAVKQQLPMVRTIQVPANLTDYPQVVQHIKELFLSGGISVDSHSKTMQYKLRAETESAKAQFYSQEAYLASLEICVTIRRNIEVQVPRISELTMKSNQFNLTTLRYSESEISEMMKSGNHDIYALSVIDRFGDSGLTGIVIIRYEESDAHIENFLMSCRVIGRGIETAIWSTICDDLKKNGCKQLIASYIPTRKNGQVSDFYDHLGFILIMETTEGSRNYKVSLDDFSPPDCPWITIT